MVYRTSTDPSAAEPPADGKLVLAASGRRGVDGIDGRDGEHGEGRGRSGRSGGDAGLPSCGEDGGQITITLRGDEAREAVVAIEGEIFTGANGTQHVDTEIDIHGGRTIELEARGGAGGDGGKGGDGGGGAPGRNGADATRYSSGGDGGPGGDGGDGGNGTSGERGGAGGHVRVRVGEHDTPFLMLVREHVRGGKGGKAGENGRGGTAGKGGRGGSSYSWTETEHYTDANGQAQTRSHSHSNSGGSNGRSGRIGRSGNAVLRDGARGAEGKFTIEVIGERGTNAYESCFDLRLRSFRHRNENDDGIYEPEENVFVSHVEVENVGGMPLPAHHDVLVRLVDDGWIAPIAEKYFTLPRSLGPGERHVFDDAELPLELRLFRPQKTGAPLAAPETIRLFAELPRVKRSFENFETPENKAHGGIIIRFPVEVSEPAALFSLAPGQATRVKWRLSNVSKKSFGARAETGRAIGVRLVLGGGEISERGVCFFDDEDRLVNLGAGFDRDVAYLEAEGALEFEGTIAVPADAVPYTSARFVVSAELGHIADPKRARAVHYQEITIRVGRPFEARGADVLLVVNNRTNAPEVAAWENRLRACGLDTAIWDASLEGGVDVLRGQTNYPLIVLLNDKYDTPTGERRASTLIDQETTLSLAKNGTHVLYVGEVPKLESLLVPTGEAESTQAEHRWFWWPWSQPKPEQLEARANTISSKLAHDAPEKRHVVVHDFKPEVERKIAWLRKVKLGSVEVRRSLHRHALHGLTAESARVHDAAFVDTAVTNDLVLRALPFEAKLKLLASVRVIEGVKVEDGCNDAVVAAVLDALIAEQSAAIHHRWRKSELAKSLPLFHQFIASTTEASSRIVELVAWLDLIARDHVELWEWLPPLAFIRRGPQLRRIIRRELKQLVARLPKDTQGAIKVRRKELRKAKSRQSALDFAEDRLAERFASRETTTDANALPHDKRVLDRERHEELAQKEKRRVEKATEALASAADARRALLRTETCAALLEGAQLDAEVVEEARATSEA